MHRMRHGIHDRRGAPCHIYRVRSAARHPARTCRSRGKACAAYNAKASARAVAARSQCVDLPVMCRSWLAPVGELSARYSTRCLGAAVLTASQSAVKELIYTTNAQYIKLCVRLAVWQTCPSPCVLCRGTGTWPWAPERKPRRLRVPRQRHRGASACASSEQCTYRNR